jgi:hypothetical protein
MSGDILPLPQYAFVAWCSITKKAQGQLYFTMKGRQDNFLSLNVTQASFFVSESEAGSL